jgi:hypothetical protein
MHLKVPHQLNLVKRRLSWTQSTSGDRGRSETYVDGVTAHRNLMTHQDFTPWYVRRYGVQSEIRRALTMALPLCHCTDNTVGKSVKQLTPSGDDEPNKTQQQLNRVVKL